MNLSINNEPYIFDKEKKLSEVLEHLKIRNTTGIAVAVNDTIVTRTQWNSVTVKHNDKVLIIQATQGG